MRKILQIIVLLVFSAVCSPACAQSELEQLGKIMKKNGHYSTYNTLSPEIVAAIVTYRNYLADKNSVSVYKAVEAAKELMGKDGCFDDWTYLGVVLPIMKTLPKQYLGDLVKTSPSGISCSEALLNNGKLIKDGLDCLNVQFYLSIDGSYDTGYKKLLLNPDRSFGAGYLIKKSDANKKNVPYILVKTVQAYDFDKNGDYVIACGYTGNTNTINELEVFERAVGLRNDTKGDKWGFQDDDKTEYWLGRESITLKKIRLSDADLSAFENAKERNQREIKAKREAENTEKYWGDDIRKYGAAAVKRLRTQGPWIGMPGGLIKNHYYFVKSTESFGSIVEIYRGRGVMLWVRNGKVTKIVKSR